MLLTVGEFHELMGPQTNQIGEATDQLLSAKRLIEEIGARRAGRAAGLTGQPLAADEDSEYVFVFLVDTLRADHVGAYGYPRPTTPSIDRLAREGVVVERVTSQSSLTNTSVASLLTGLYPTSHLMVGKKSWLWRKNLVAELRRGGYATGAISANPIITRAEHFDHGFDSFEEVAWCRSAVVLEETKRWLDRARETSRRVFTYVHLMDPHDIYFPPSPYLEKFSGARAFRAAAYWIDWMIENEFPALAAEHPECAFDPGRDKWGELELVLACLSKSGEGIDLSLADIENLIDRYDGEIAYVDAQIGRFADYLERIGVLPRSTIVVVSDHGEAFFEHNRLRHGRELYQTQVRVPLIVWRGGDRLAPRRVTGSRQVVDVMPSLFEMLGLPLSEEVHGRSLLQAAPADRRVYSMSWNGRELTQRKHVELYAVASDSWKYIEVVDGKGGSRIRGELYDLQADPKETREISDERPGKLEQFRGELAQWREKTSVSASPEIGALISEGQRERLRALGYVD